MWQLPQGMGWWMIFGGLWVVLFWVAVIALIIWGVRKIAEPGERQKDSSSSPSPLDIARARFARGEISKEQFEQLKKDLS